MWENEMVIATVINVRRSYVPILLCEKKRTKNYA